jgi:hypothetical protein
VTRWPTQSVAYPCELYSRRLAGGSVAPRWMRASRGTSARRSKGTTRSRTAKGADDSRTPRTKQEPARDQSARSRLVPRGRLPGRCETLARRAKEERASVKSDAPLACFGCWPSSHRAAGRRIICPVLVHVERDRPGWILVRRRRRSARDLARAGGRRHRRPCRRRPLLPGGAPRETAHALAAFLSSEYQ